MKGVISTYIVKGQFTAQVTTNSDPESDGFKYKCMETGYESTSQKMAVNNALAYLAKQWEKFQKKIGKVKREVDIKIPEKTLTEIRELQKAQSIPKTRRIFTIKDDEEYNAEKLKLEHLIAIPKPRTPRTRTKQPAKLIGIKRVRTKAPIKKTTITKIVRVRTKPPVKKQLIKKVPVKKKQEETLVSQLKSILERKNKK